MEGFSVALVDRTFAVDPERHARSLPAVRLNLQGLAGPQGSKFPKGKVRRGQPGISHFSHDHTSFSASFRIRTRIRPA
jgi:hypothetical protein